MADKSVYTWSLQQGRLKRSGQTSYRSWLPSEQTSPCIWVQAILTFPTQPQKSHGDYCWKQPQTHSCSGEVGRNPILDGRSISKTSATKTQKTSKLPRSVQPASRYPSTFPGILTMFFFLFFLCTWASHLRYLFFIFKHFLADVFLIS